MKIKITKSISDNKILWIVLLLPHLKTDYIENVKILDTVFNLGRVMSGLVIIFLWIVKRKMHLERLSLLLMIMQFWLLLCTYLNHLSIRDSLLRLISFVCIVLLMEYMFSRNSIKGLKCIWFVLSTFIFLNFLTILLYPEGLYNLGGERKSFFLGHVNSMITYVLPALIISIILFFVEKGKVFKVLLICVSILTQLITWSATSIVGLAFLGVLFIVTYHRKIVISPFYSFVTGMVLFGAVYFFKVQYFFQGLIENVLQRNLNFTRRTVLWDITLRYIRLKKWTGYGVESVIARRMKLGAPNSHSFYIEIVYQGGIILLILFFVFFILLSVQLKNGGKFAGLISKAIFSLLIMSIVESFYGQTVFWLLILLGVYAKEVDEGLEKLKEQNDEQKRFERNLEANHYSNGG